MWRGVRRLLDGRTPGPLRILDVGCGAGDIPRVLEARLRASGWRPRCVLADLHPVTLRIAREALGSAPRPGSFRFVRLTAAGLPFADGSFDLALSSLTLHHLEHDEAGRLLAELARVSSGRWLVADLRRSRMALGLVRMLSTTLWRREPLPRVDGPVSVRRAFTPAEVEALLAASGVPGRVVRAGPVRFLATGRAA